MIKVDLTTNGLLSQLGEEVIAHYDTGPSGAAVADIVNALLGFQRKATKITVGTISVTGTRAVQVTSARTILSVLLELQETVGGYLYVTPARVLNWLAGIGEDKGQQIRYRKNLMGIERSINYQNLCTKLHLTGGIDGLDTIVVGPIAPTITTDASYAYFTLAEQYGAYLGFTAEGDPLPETFKVWTETSAPDWVSGVASGVDWDDDGSDPTDASDGDVESSAWQWYVGAGNWTGTLAITFADTNYYKVKWHTHYDRTIKIETYNPDDGYQTVYEGASGADTWGYQTFSNRRVTALRVRILNNKAWEIDIYVDEIQLEESDLVDVSADFVQGEWENIVRCAIGVYDAGESYTVEYTHADYLMAWDKITDADDIVARIVSLPSYTYGISMLEYGKLLLDELKESEITYSVNMANLAEVDAKFSFDKLQLGSIVTIIDEELGIDVSARVVKIRFPDLQSPERMEIELSSRIRDIADIIANMNKLIG